MKSNGLKILFILLKSRTNRKGLCPIRCRLTYNGKRKIFSIGLSVNPELWDSKNQVKLLSDDDSFINDNLEIIRHKIQESYLKLKVQKEVLTVNDIFSDFKGVTLKAEKGTIEVFNLHNSRIEKLVGIEIKEVTYSKYQESCKHLSDFIKWKFKKNDIEINSLKSVFISNYEYYLKTEKKLQQSTINKAIQRFRKVITYAVAEEYLNRNPFLLYKPKRVKKEVIFLTKTELVKLETQQFKIDRLNRVRDMFVFCCYSGLAFKEMINLKKEDIYEEFDNKLWIHIYRAKTERMYKIPLMKKAQAISDKYCNENSEYILPRMHNQNFNAFLKEIAIVCGIKKNLTHHIARKTFATTILLYNDVPMEIVSELLGHSKIQTTQDHYGKIVQNRVSQQMESLSIKLNNN